MIALALIMLLAGLLVVGFKAVLAPNQALATKAQLEVARALLNEPGALDRVKELYRIHFMVPPPEPFNFSAVTLQCPPGAMNNNVRWLFTAEARNGRRITSPAKVMEGLYTFSNNKKTRDGLPSEKVKRIDQPLGIAVNPATPEPANATFLLDTWGNPIIFVPPGGLVDVRYAADLSNAKTVTSNGVINTGATLPAGTRGFFASAGPDGIFGWADVDGNNQFNPGTDIAGGDDNLYSFEN